MNHCGSRCILVVEDDPVVRGLVADALEGTGCRIETAKDDEAVWAALLVNYYDLLVTDDPRSRSSGLRLVKKIRTVSCLDFLQS